MKEYRKMSTYTDRQCVRRRHGVLLSIGNRGSFRAGRQVMANLCTLIGCRPFLHWSYVDHCSNVLLVCLIQSRVRVFILFILTPSVTPYWYTSSIFLAQYIIWCSHLCSYSLISSTYITVLTMSSIRWLECIL